LGFANLGAFTIFNKESKWCEKVTKNKITNQNGDTVFQN